MQLIPPVNMKCHVSQEDSHFQKKEVFTEYNHKPKFVLDAVSFKVQIQGKRRHDKVISNSAFQRYLGGSKESG